jgi:hypothetical protein
VKEDQHRRELEMKEKEIEIIKLNNAAKSEKPSESDIKTTRPKLPKFDDENDDMDAYLQRFELFAQIQKWKKEEWAVSLSPLLTGKGLQVFTCMSAGEVNDYDKLKKALLKRYQLTEEGFNRKFREAQPENDESVFQFISRVKRYFQRWVEMAGIDRTYDKLQDLMIQEQYLNTCNREMKIFLRERTPKNLDELITLAERYTEAHSTETRSTGEVTESTADSLEINKAAAAVREEVSYKDPRGERRCFICNRNNHIARNCYYNEANRKHRASDSTSDVDQEPRETAGSSISMKSHNEMPTTSGTMPVCEGIINNVTGKVLRDTGCSTVAVSARLVDKNQMTGEEARCVLIDGTERKFPLAKINIDTPYYTGDVTAMCMQQPIYELILGNIPSVRSEPDPTWKASSGNAVHAEQNRNTVASVHIAATCIEQARGGNRKQETMVDNRNLTGSRSMKRRGSKKTKKKEYDRRTTEF